MGGKEIQGLAFRRKGFQVSGVRVIEISWQYSLKILTLQRYLIILENFTHAPFSM